MALVKFYTTTQTAYNTAKTNGTLLDGALYFITDTKRLCKGATLYGGSFEYCDSTPTSGTAGTLYFNAATGNLLTWNGTGFDTKFIPFETTLTDTDAKVPTSKAIKKYVDDTEEALSGAADASISAAIQTLDVGTIGGSGQIITTISETDGKIAATAINLTTAAVARTATTNVSGETAEAALEDLGAKIATINSNDSTAGSIAKAVKDAKDALSGAIGGEFDSSNTVKKYIDDINTAKGADIAYVSGVVATINNTAETAGSFRAGDAALSAAIGGTFDANNTVSAAIAAINAAAIHVFGADDNAIEVVESGEGNVNKTIGLKIKSGDKFLSQTADGLSATFELVKADTLISGNVNAAEYYLADKNGAQVGARINIPKDQFLKSVSFVEGQGSKDDKLHFVFTTAAGDVEQDVDLSGLFNEYEAGNGITLTASSTGIIIAGKVDSESETFLTVDAGGFKLAGVQTAIDTAVSASGSFLSGAIGSGFNSTDTVKKYVDDTRNTLSGQIGSGFGVGTTSGTVAAYIEKRISDINSAMTDGLAGKLDDVLSGHPDEVIIAKNDGEVQVSGKKIGGATIAAEPTAATLATEAAVSALIDTKLTWGTL